jgi:hypothetical protein
LSEIFLILRIIQRDIVINVYNVPVSDFSETCIVSTVSKNTPMSDFMIIRPVGAELFHVDTQTDMTKQIVLFTSARKQVKMVTLHTGKVHHLAKSPTGAPGRHIPLYTSNLLRSAIFSCLNDYLNPEVDIHHKTTHQSTSRPNFL